MLLLLGTIILKRYLDISTKPSNVIPLSAPLKQELSASYTLLKLAHFLRFFLYI
jgi:hypothetical protein